MLCAISGESPRDPVISSKSGQIFERRLIETYIQENGKDPVTGAELVTDDLITIKTSRTVKPRPPTLTSIPSLLSVFQNEWDALALETFNLRQHLSQVRQELSNALYENDAAKRVIARIQDERDQARDALAKVSVNGAVSRVNGDAMQLDLQELKPELVAKVEATQEGLSKTRRKRPVPEDWVTAEGVQSFNTAQTSKPLYPKSRRVAVDENGDLALFGGDGGRGGTYSLSEEMVTQEFDVEDQIADSLWKDTTAVVATSVSGIKLLENGVLQSTLEGPSGNLGGITLHPSGDILASVGDDATCMLHDLTTGSKVLQITTDSGLTTAQFHPDGHLIAAGAKNGQIKIFDVKTGANAANFEESGPIQALQFSENGIWLAAVAKGSRNVSIWDLRKAEKVKEVDMGGPVVTVKWDYTGQFLAAAGPGGLTVQGYDKGRKEWTGLLAVAVPGVAIEWGKNARSLVVVNEEGVVTVLEAS